MKRPVQLDGRRRTRSTASGWATRSIRCSPSIPLGAWTAALALDAASNGNPGMRRPATFAMGVGLTGAVGAAVSGLTTGAKPVGGPAAPD